MLQKLFISFLFFFQLLLANNSMVAQTIIYIVAADGTTQFKTIQSAIDALPDDTSTKIIHLKKGTYTEQIFIKKKNIFIVGTNQAECIITAAIARDEFRCNHTDDWGVATVNIGADEITFMNITITNSYGFDNDEKFIFCDNDTSVTHQKKIRKDGHQMALRTMNASKLRAINCRFVSFGGDTVSPWEVDNGMWYFKNCTIEGGVDFYCPRGWAWAEECTFIAHNGPASIWHDGSKNEDAKSVFLHCNFKGYNNFNLGRYHRDAQFYLINCTFDDNISNTPIYLVATNNQIKWGERIYFYNCKKNNGQTPSWAANHLPDTVQPNDIKVQWVFKNKWSPDKF